MFSIERFLLFIFIDSVKEHNITYCHIIVAVESGKHYTTPTKYLYFPRINIYYNIYI